MSAFLGELIVSFVTDYDKIGTDPGEGERLQKINEEKQAKEAEEKEKNEHEAGAQSAGMPALGVDGSGSVPSGYNPKYAEGLPSEKPNNPIVFGSHGGSITPASNPTIEALRPVRHVAALKGLDDKKLAALKVIRLTGFNGSGLHLEFHQ